MVDLLAVIYGLKWALVAGFVKIIYNSIYLPWCSPAFPTHVAGI